jgi:DNA-binding transcriptional regulator of glucitol operon
MPHLCGQITSSVKAGAPRRKVALTYRLDVKGSYRFALKPRWIALHLVCLALCVTMILLGRWQLTVSNHKHFALQNFGYALQWWAFTLFVAWMWFRLLRDNANASVEGPEQPKQDDVPYRRYVMPTLSETPAAQADPELVAYNEYLARLAQDEGKT